MGSSDSTALLWEASTGVCSRVLEGHEAGITSVAWTPYGSALATASKDHTARLWSATTGDVTHRLEPHGAAVWAVACSPDGGFIATGFGDQSTRVWNRSTGALMRALEGHADSVRSVAGTPVDGICFLHQRMAHCACTEAHVDRGLASLTTFSVASTSRRRS